MTTAGKIRAARLKLGLTQVQAAERLGVAQSRWAEIESDRHSPTLRMLARVATALGVKAEELVSFPESP